MSGGPRPWLVVKPDSNNEKKNHTRQCSVHNTSILKECLRVQRIAKKINGPCFAYSKEISNIFGTVKRLCTFDDTSKKQSKFNGQSDQKNVLRETLTNVLIYSKRKMSTLI